MGEVELTVLIKDYDHVAPLAAGDIDVPDIELNLVRDTPNALDRTLNDPSIDVGELSFSRHIIRLSRDDHSFVGIPVFPTQRFRERCFYTRTDTDLTDLAELEGTRIGTNEWPATGNTWSRAAIRERGVGIDTIDWLVGQVNDPETSLRPHDELPDNVAFSADGVALRDLLLDGELDALMCPRPPDGFYDDDVPIRRVYPDYRAAEREFYERTGIYPPHHLMGIRRDVFEENPWIATQLYDAFQESKLAWQAERRYLTDTVPWLLPEIEEATELFGEDWLPYGVEPKREEIAMLCEEEVAQGLIDRPVDPETVFAEFAELAD